MARNVDASLALIDELELQIARLSVELKRSGADHRYIPLLITARGFGEAVPYSVVLLIATPAPVRDACVRAGHRHRGAAS